MKTKITPLRNPNPAFAEVASIIAKGLPPEWLVLGLEHFSGLLGLDPMTSDEDKQIRKSLSEMDYAADLLIRRLPLFAILHAGVQCPDDVALALDVLPRIRKLLACVAKPPARKGGQHPNTLRKICAAVVVEAWRIIHRKPEPRSVELWEACNKYWQACGGEYRGEVVDNWRRDAEEAAEGNNAFIRTVLSTLAVRN